METFNKGVNKSKKRENKSLKGIRNIEFIGVLIGFMTLTIKCKNSKIKTVNRKIALF